MHWLKERIHPTWHFTAVMLGFVTGVIFAQWYSVEPIVGGLLGVGCLVVAFWRRRRMLLVIACCGGLLLGSARGAVDMSSREVYRGLVGESKLEIDAKITDDVDATTRGRVHLKLDNVTIGGQKLPGRIFATVSNADGARRSDCVKIIGRVDQGFGNFVATITGVVAANDRASQSDMALNIRDGFAGHVQTAVHDPAASLGTGYLLGKKSALPDDLATALQVTGLTHIVVASGYNLTVLVRAGRRLFARVSKYLAMISGVGLVAGFVLMTGTSATMTRAGIVALLGLWAWYYGRTFHPVTLLATVAGITLMIDPSFGWGDLGWSLSFAAFAGVMIVAPIVTCYFFGKDKASFIGQLFIETISAQLATLPIMVLAFHQMSIVAPFANLLILPFIPLAMVLVAVAGLGAWLMPGLAGVIGWPAEQLLNAQIAIVNWFSEVPGALLKPSWTPVVVVLYIAVVVVVVVYMKWRTKFVLRTSSIVE